MSGTELNALTFRTMLAMVWLSLLRPALGTETVLAGVFPTGAFTIRMARLRAEYMPDASWEQSLLLQRDNLSNSLGFSARLRWQRVLGQELLLTLDRLSYTEDEPQPQPAQTRLMLKHIWNLQ